MEGETAFMQAISERAYSAGELLLNAIRRVVARTSGESGQNADMSNGGVTGEELEKGDAALLESMLFPEGSRLHANPLHLLVANDTCSFTWTGRNHIEQVSRFLLLTSLHAPPPKSIYT